MDNRTRERLSRIGNSIPREMMQRAQKTVQSESQRDMVERAVHEAKRKGRDTGKAERLLAQGAFDGKVKTVVDEKGSDEIERWVQAKVEKDMAAGRIKPADKGEIERVRGN